MYVGRSDDRSELVDQILTESASTGKRALRPWGAMSLRSRTLPCSRRSAESGQPCLTAADASCSRSVKASSATGWRLTYVNPVDWLSTLVGTLADQGSRFDSSCRGPQQDRLPGGLLLRAPSSCSPPPHCAAIDSHVTGVHRRKRASRDGNVTVT